MSDASPSWAEDVCTVDDAAEMIGVSAIYVRKLIAAGRIVALKFGRDHVVDRESAEAFASSRRVASAAS